MPVKRHGQVLGDRFYAYLESYVSNAQAARDLPPNADYDVVMGHTNLLWSDVEHLARRMDVGQYGSRKVARLVQEAEELLETSGTAADRENAYQRLRRLTEYSMLLVACARTAEPR